MSNHLTVVNPFGNYKRGDHVTDPAEVKKLVLERPHDVVQRHPHAHHHSGDFYRTDAEIAHMHAEHEAQKAKTATQQSPTAPAAPLAASVVAAAPVAATTKP